MSKNQWTERDIRRVITNPYYALAEQPIIDRQMWIQANVKMLAEIGAEAWLNNLLDTLEQMGFGKGSGVEK